MVDEINCASLAGSITSPPVSPVQRLKFVPKFQREVAAFVSSG